MNIFQIEHKTWLTTGKCRVPISALQHTVMQNESGILGWEMEMLASVNSQSDSSASYSNYLHMLFKQITTSKYSPSH